MSKRPRHSCTYNYQNAIMCGIEGKKLKLMGILDPEDREGFFDCYGSAEDEINKILEEDHCRIEHDGKECLFGTPGHDDCEGIPYLKIGVVMDSPTMIVERKLDGTIVSMEEGEETWTCSTLPEDIETNPPRHLKHFPDGAKFLCGSYCKAGYNSYAWIMACDIPKKVEPKSLKKSRKEKK